MVLTIGSSNSSSFVGENVLMAILCVLHYAILPIDRLLLKTSGREGPFKFFLMCFEAWTQVKVQLDSSGDEGALNGEIRHMKR